jgi:hypothetical protein
VNARNTNPARRIIDEATRRRIAVLAGGADPRTVDKVLLGQPVRGDVRLRVLAVLEDCGIAPLSPDSAEGRQ